MTGDPSPWPQEAPPLPQIRPSSPEPTAVLPPAHVSQGLRHPRQRAWKSWRTQGALQPPPGEQRPRPFLVSDEWLPRSVFSVGCGLHPGSQGWRWELPADTEPGARATRGDGGMGGWGGLLPRLSHMAWESSSGFTGARSGRKGGTQCREGVGPPRGRPGAILGLWAGPKERHTVVRTVDSLRLGPAGLGGQLSL